jgi:bla regulator protein blaR1
VIDQTGLIGRFDYKLEWAPEPTTPTADAPAGPTFLQALEDQLGLKLKSTRAPVRTLVIDHIERPSEN